MVDTDYNIMKALSMLSERLNYLHNQMENSVQRLLGVAPPKEIKDPSMPDFDYPTNVREYLDYFNYLCDKILANSDRLDKSLSFGEENVIDSKCQGLQKVK